MESCVKTFKLPVSDCGDFVVGQINADTFKDDTKPEFGIVVWYKSKELAKLAAQSVMSAHWGNKMPTDNG